MPRRPIKKVMLIYPPIANVRLTNNICTLPMGIASLAAYLRERTDLEFLLLDAVVEGHDHVEDLDDKTVKFGLSYHRIQERVRAFGPDLLGVSAIFSSQLPFVREIVKRAKAEDPDLFAVTGGAYPSFMPERALETSALDAVVIGEGELTLQNLIEKLNAGESPRGLPALAFRDNAGISVNSERRMIADLDTLPLPARDLLPVEKYFAVNLPMQAISRHRRNLSVATSRGCPYRCRFCSSTIHWGKQYRMRSAANVLHEFEVLKERFGVREIKFEDDNLTFDQDRAKAIFKGMIERKLGLFWNTPNGIAVRHLDDEMLELMKRSGCYELTLAVESGDPEVLKNIIHKPLDLSEARAAAERIKAHGIETAGYFIIGFPGETRRQIENTLRFALDLKLDRSYIFMYTPLPGTELAELAIARGLLREGFDFEKQNNYFLPSVKLPDLSFEELIRMQRRAFWAGNLRLLLRPGRFLKKYGNTLLSHPGLVLKFFRAVRE
jgi:magnesium-protoporphyrin IX monomethyl ester (oxidative) cyclase